MLCKISYLRQSGSRKSEIVDMAKKAGGEGFQDVDLGEVQGITDTVQQEVTEDDVMEMNDSEPAPDKEDDVERKQ